MKRRTLVRVIVFASVLLAGLVLAGCASTHVEATWGNPEYAGRTVGGRLLVVGVTRDETIRRLYEDAMAVRLHARGADVVRSYDVLGTRLADGDGAALLEAAKKAGAARILSTAIVSREHVQTIQYEPMPPAWSYYGWYGVYWPYGYARADARDYDRYIASTTLTDAANGKVYWSARTESEVPGSVAREVDDFANVLVEELAARGLL